MNKEKELVWKRLKEIRPVISQSVIFNKQTKTIFFKPSGNTPYSVNELYSYLRDAWEGDNVS